MDRLRGAHLFVAGHSRQSRTTCVTLRPRGLGPAAATAIHVVQFDAGHDPCAAALHGARALQRDEENRAFLLAGGREPRRASARCVSVRVSPAQPAGNSERQRAGVHHVPGFLHHPHPARHAQGHDDFAAHQPADRGFASLGLRLRDRGRIADRHAGAAWDL